VPAGIDQVKESHLSAASSMTWLMWFSFVEQEFPKIRLRQSCRWTWEALPSLYNATFTINTQVRSAEHEHHYFHSIFLWLHPHPELLSKKRWYNIYCTIRVSSHP
jgi:hypothetical protein